MNQPSTGSPTDQGEPPSQATRHPKGLSGSSVTLLTFCLLMFLSVLPAGADTQPVRILLVVNEENSLQSLSIKDLSNVFLRKQTTVQGQRLEPLNLKTDHPLRQFFDRKVHGMSTRQVEQYWLERKVKAEASEPRTLSRPFVVAFMIKQFKKSIGYIPWRSWKKLTDEQRRSLRILPIRLTSPEGSEVISFRSPRYPLRDVVSR